MITDPVTMSYLDALNASELAEQENILLSRNYYEGKQDVTLTDRLDEFLSQHPGNTFCMNLCKTIVGSLANELSLSGFTTAEEGESRAVAEWAQGVYDINNLDTLQDSVHDGALSDRESYVIVDWDATGGYPKMTHNQQFIDVNAGGDGMGCWAVYENNDLSQAMEFAVKQWIQTDYYENGSPYYKTRRTIYYPDRIERWVYDAGWQKYTDDIEEDWPIKNVDSSGKPLGIPVFHFTNKAYVSEHWDAIPMQDLTNKTLIDIAQANDLTAFKSFLFFGFFPTTDGKELKDDLSNQMKLGPGIANGTTKTPDQASVEEISGADNTPLVTFLKDLILFTAQITDTPSTKFVTTAQIASADTIMAQHRMLKKKAEDRRARFGDTWSNAMDMARKLNNLNNTSGKLDEDIEIAPVWEVEETIAEISEKISILGIPQEQAWREAGYSEAEIISMRNDPTYRVEFERKLWEGFDAATAQGVSLNTYLKRVGLPDDEILEITQALGTDIPTVTQ